MNKIVLILAVLLSGLFFAACTPPQRMYYFGNYSQTLYSLEKNNNEETLKNHKQELESIITESGVRSLPVPPGIFAELGYLNLKANSAAEAIRLFQAESELYPESKQLMERLIQSAKAKEGDKAKVSGLPPSKDSSSN